jgi:outer membrane protein assembly factor BamA
VRTAAHLGACIALALAIFAGAGCVRDNAEGRPWIHDIRFVGLRSVSKRDLKKKISIQETSWMPWAPRKYLDPFALPGDRARIEAYYHAHGYFDAHVTAADVHSRKKPGSVDIEFQIDEGQLTRITGVEVEGVEDAGLKTDEVRKKLKLKIGTSFIHDQYLEAKDLLRERLRMKGYAWAQVHGEVEVDRDARGAAIQLEAVPGPLVRIGRVEVEGNDRVRAVDIERTADLTTGRLYSPLEIETARGRVYNTGVFGSVRLELVRDPIDPSIAHVQIHVQESTFRELRLGGGLAVESQRNDVHLFVQYTRRNFLGGLRTLRLRLEPAFVVVPALWNIARYGPAAIAEAEFKQPFLFGLRHLGLRWLVGYDLGIDYAFQYHGPRTQLGLIYGLWRNHVQLGLSYNIQFLDFFNTAPGVLSDPALSGSVYGYVDPFRVAWWQEDLGLDLRDKPLDPHQGAYFLVSAEEGGVYTGSAFEYEKIVPDARAYAPLGSRVTFAARMQYGRVWSQGDLGSPITRRLYLGGPNSHRGFNYNRLSYQIPSGQQNVPPLPIGGDEMVLIQGELRVRIVKISGNWFGLVAFADGGDVAMPRCRRVDESGAGRGATTMPGDCPPGLATALQRIDFSQLHWAVGGGLRYNTVIGTIRLDVGVRLNRLEDAALPTPDPGQRIAYHLSVGEAF